MLNENEKMKTEKKRLWISITGKSKVIQYQTFWNSFNVAKEENAKLFE